MAANSPHFLETMGAPEPFCIKSLTGRYVGCEIDENFEFTCRVDDRCNAKWMDIKLEEEIEQYNKETTLTASPLQEFPSSSEPQIDLNSSNTAQTTEQTENQPQSTPEPQQNTAPTNATLSETSHLTNQQNLSPAASNASAESIASITGNVVNELGLETDLTNILEPESNTTTETTTSTTTEASSPDAAVEQSNINTLNTTTNQGNFGTGQVEQRASQIKFNHLKINTKGKNNFACKLAKLAINLASTNKQRHEAIQDFFLINDSTTIAVEVPVYLTNWDAGYYRNQKGFIFPLSDYKTPITGHIDILQIRNGLIHILDYKPEAKNQNPIEQLTIYALALSRKLNLPLYYFKCAWFDENSYFEFFPLHAVYEKYKKKTKDLYI